MIYYLLFTIYTGIVQVVIYSEAAWTTADDK